MQRVFRTIHRTIRWLALALCAGLPLAAGAQYPDRPIRVVVPYTPGGAVDVLMRSLGQKLGEAWGQQIVVDNRPGAGGSIGAALVAKARPDGYTLLISTNSPLTTNPVLYANVGYDPLADFEPVIIAGGAGLVVVVGAKTPVKSVADLIALAKEKPRATFAATSGNGTTAHLGLAQFNKMAGVDIVHVPYKGGVPSLTAAVAGEVQVTFSDLVPALPLIRDGRIRALASTGLRRPGIAPDIPTLNESGLSGFNIDVWLGMVAPKGTPKDVVLKLNREINRIIKEPQFARQLLDLGIDPIGNTPEEFSEFLRQEMPRWKGIVAQAGIKVE